MGIQVDQLKRRLHHPEYTGENRCIPCTSVNIALAAIASVAVSTFSIPAGIAVAGLSATIIYFRGYLVPGTPTLTKQYFPDRVLRWFDKTPRTTVDTTLDTEEQLLSLGVIEETKGDLSLTDSFESQWTSTITRVKQNPEAHLAAELGYSKAEVRDRGDACVVVDDGHEVARLPSRTALVADLAAVKLLQNRTKNWVRLSDSEQEQLLTGLRIFLEECPMCSGTPTFVETLVESCCRSKSVILYKCGKCESRLAEVET
ncbi:MULTISPECIES: hypothetical protein [Halorussus]|uniref:hypothetical protein n=1 Tax=Halorussus TaxID=1070314 RepID=UPI0020A16083|nr:hypothetical protein [Halorussus vallis]USZ78461.1 hypothetical protein NGM07_24260 [Halorussus vallis]USZ78493.1 hypothetical protein NGM07_23675 [Halorussus vallis]